VLDALLMALWHRQPTGPVLVHSDQGSQFPGHDWQDFLRDHNLVKNSPVLPANKVPEPEEPYCNADSQQRRTLGLLTGALRQKCPKSPKLSKHTQQQPACHGIPDGIPIQPQKKKA